LFLVPSGVIRSVASKQEPRYDAAPITTNSA
jgi:hypothetical protein